MNLDAYPCPFPNSTIAGSLRANIVHITPKVPFHPKQIKAIVLSKLKTLTLFFSDDIYLSITVIVYRDAATVLSPDLKAFNAGASQ